MMRLDWSGNRSSNFCNIKYEKYTSISRVCTYIDVVLILLLFFAGFE